MNSLVPKKAANRRIDPEIRKSIILDKTAILIAKEGVSAVSMERIGREAGVSKALVYAYFKNQTNLLQSLLLREQRRLMERQSVAVSQATNFEELVLFTTRAYLKHYEEDGIFLQRLLHEPSLAVAFEERDRAERQRVVDFLSKEMARSFGVSQRVAAIATELSMGMTGAAGAMISRGAISRTKVEEIITCLFDGSMKSLSEKFARSTVAKPFVNEP